MFFAFVAGSSMREKHGKTASVMAGRSLGEVVWLYVQTCAEACCEESVVTNCWKRFWREVPEKCECCCSLLFGNVCGWWRRPR